MEIGTRVDHQIIGGVRGTVIGHNTPGWFLVKWDHGKTTEEPRSMLIRVLTA